MHNSIENIFLIKFKFVLNKRHQFARQTQLGQRLQGRIHLRDLQLLVGGWISGLITLISSSSVVRGFFLLCWVSLCFLPAGLYKEFASVLHIKHTHHISAISEHFYPLTQSVQGSLSHLNITSSKVPSLIINCLMADMRQLWERAVLRFWLPSLKSSICYSALHTVGAHILLACRHLLLLSLTAFCICCAIAFFCYGLIFHYGPLRSSL